MREAGDDKEKERGRSWCRKPEKTGRDERGVSSLHVHVMQTGTMEIRDTKNRKQLAVGKRKCEKGGALGAQGRKQEACNKHNRGSSVQLRNTEEEGVHAVRRAKGGEKKRREADDGRYTKSFCEKALEKAVRSVRFGKTERRWGRTKYTVHSAVHSGSALSKASEWSTGENGEFGNTRGVKDGRWRCPPLPPANEGGMDRSQGRWRAHRA